jgi:CRP-like cAMP-binding protein
MAGYETLKPASLLAGLSDSQLKMFWEAGTMTTVAASDPVIREGDVGNTMYILLEGVVEVSQSLVMKVGRGDIGEKEKTLIRLEGGTRPCFGEMSLLEDAERSATVAALTDTKLFVIDRANFDSLIGKDPTLGTVVLRNIARLVSARLRKANNDVLKLTTALSLALTG